MNPEPRPYRGNLVRSSAAMDTWLARRPTEVALEPGLPIVDAHHHLMAVPALGIRYLLDEFQADLATGHHIVSTVYVEASAMYRAHGPEALRPVGEVEFARGAAAVSDSGLYGPTRVAEAIVAHADLSRGDAVRPVLQALCEAGGGRVRGIRHVTVHDSGEVGRHLARRCPPRLLADPAFRRGVAALLPLGLGLDVWVFHPQLPEVADLAAAFPQLPIVLNHAGTLLGVAEHARDPGAAWRQWRQGLALLAPWPNVTVKFGGLGMPVAGLPFHGADAPPGSEVLAAAWQPYLDTCLDLFGPARCMFESNFPVDRQSCGYAELWNAFKRMTRALPPGERGALFGATAARVYRLAWPAALSAP